MGISHEVSKPSGISYERSFPAGRLTSGVHRLKESQKNCPQVRHSAALASSRYTLGAQGAAPHMDDILASQIGRPAGSRPAGFLAAALPACELTPEELEQARKEVAWLFRRLQRRVSGVIAAGGRAEVNIGSDAESQCRADQALRMLVRCSGNVQWQLAIELETHPFHQEWRDLLAWGHRERLFSRLPPLWTPFSRRQFIRLRLCR
jgi:hypothetical protein